MRGDPLRGLANLRKKCYTALYECPLHEPCGAALPLRWEKRAGREKQNDEIRRGKCR